MTRWVYVIMATVAAVAAASPSPVYTPPNEIQYHPHNTARIRSGDELVSAVINDCLGADAAMHCLRIRVLNYLDNLLGYAESSRALKSDDRTVDKLIYDRVARIAGENEFKLSLPEFFFQGARLTYRADRGLDVDFPEEPRGADDAATVEARGLLKKKLLLPVLLLLKLKMKALMPIFVAIIGLKATKALVLSKIAIVLVVGFLVLQLVKKGGMPMPMSMMPTPEPTAPSTAYGPATAANGASAATPVDSYSPQWEPAAGSGPYARVWDPTSAHSVAYSAYYPGSSSSSSYSSPTYTSQSSSASSSIPGDEASQ